MKMFHYLACLLLGMALASGEPALFFAGVMSGLLPVVMRDDK